MRKRLAWYGWFVGVGLGLTALVLAVVPASVPRAALRGSGLNAPGIGTVPGLAVNLPVGTVDPVDTVDETESNDPIVFVAFLSDDPAPRTSQPVRIVRVDVKPGGPAAFPLATPLRGPPQA